MNTITISKNITKGEELVVMPRSEYARLVKMSNVIEFQPTIAQKKALIEGRKNRQQGNFLTLHELRSKLGFRC